MVTSPLYRAFKAGRLVGNDLVRATMLAQRSVDVSPGYERVQTSILRNGMHYRATVSRPPILSACERLEALELKRLESAIANMREAVSDASGAPEYSALLERFARKTGGAP